MIDTNYLIVGGVVVLFAIIILIVVLLITKNKNKNKSTEVQSSILDVDNIGVKNKEEFSYGYEKEETIALNPEEIKEAIDENKDTKEE